MEATRRSDPILPPGFRFHPTDEELIVCYLMKKVENSNFSVRAIGDVDLNKSEPWELPEKAKMGEKEWYFFTLRDRKYPTGMRTNRATEAGYWKATGKDRDISRTTTNTLVGAKKTLVFYRGRAPKGLKTNWIMHEYRLEGEAVHLHNSRTSSKESEWVVCRIFQKSHAGSKKAVYHRESVTSSKPSSSNSFVACDDYSDTHSSLPPLLESPPPIGNEDFSTNRQQPHHQNYTGGGAWNIPVSTTSSVLDPLVGGAGFLRFGPMFTSTTSAYESQLYDIPGSALMSKLKQEFEEVIRPAGGPKLENLAIQTASSCSSYNVRQHCGGGGGLNDDSWENLSYDHDNNANMNNQQQANNNNNNNDNLTSFTEILNGANNSMLFRTNTATDLESLWTY